MQSLRSGSTVSLLAFGSLLSILSGCQDVMKQMPAGTDRYLNTGMSVGGAILNRPKFSESDEERMALENAQKYDSSHQMWEDPLLDAYLTDIVQRLVAQAHPRPFTYSLRVVNDGSVNAFTFGGGLLYVNAGLIARMDNEAQLAMVLAHEIAHVTESHVTKGIEGTYGIQLLGEIGRVTATSTGATAQIPPALLQKTYDYSMKAATSGHGRANESEADVVGLEYMVKAGYDPRALARMFETIERESKSSGGGGGPQWMSSHPNPGNRYNAINKEADALRVQGNYSTGEFTRVRSHLCRHL